MQVHDVPLLVNGDYQTVTYTVGSGVGVYYGFQPGTGDGLRAANSTTFVAAGGTFTVSRPVYVVAETKNATADLRVGEAAAQSSPGSPGSSGGVAALVRGLARPVHIQVPVLSLHGEDPTVPVLAAKRRGYTFITFSELYKGLLGQSLLPAKPALLTYDDAHMLQYRMVHPLVQGLGIKATLFVISGFLNRESGLQAALVTFLGVSFTATTTSGSATLSAVSNFTNVVVGSDIGGAGIPAGTKVGSVNTGAATLTMVDASGAPVNATASAAGVAVTGNATPMTWAMAKEMYDSGTWDIQNHTQIHEQLPLQSSATRLAQIAQCTSDILANIGCPTPVAIAYPQGRFNAAVIKDLVQLGLHLGVTVSGTVTATNDGAGNSDEPALLPFEAFTVNRSSQTTASWLDNMVEEVFYNWENDADNGRNAANQLNYWGGFVGAPGVGTAQHYNNGHEVDLFGASKTVFSNDYFRVQPGGRVYYRFNMQTSGQAAGLAGAYLFQYNGTVGSKSALANLPLKENTTTTSLTAYEGEVTVDPACKWVRLVLQTDAAFSAGGILKFARGMVRPPRM